MGSEMCIRDRAATGAKEMMSTAENGMKEIATEISSAFHE